MNRMLKDFVDKVDKGQYTKEDAQKWLEDQDEDKASQ
jgi:hypothetical protein